MPSSAVRTAICRRKASTTQDAEARASSRLRVEHGVARLLVVGVEGLRDGEGVLREQRHLLARTACSAISSLRAMSRSRPHDLVALLAREERGRGRARRARSQQGGDVVALVRQLGEDVARAHDAFWT